MLIKYPAEGQYFQAWESSPQPSELKMKWLIHYIMTPSSATIGSQSLLMPACDLWLKGLLYGSQSVWVGAQVTTNTLKSMSLPKIIHLPTHTGMFCSWMVLAARLHTIHEILTNCPATLVVKYTVITCCAIPPKFSLISMPHFLSQHDQNAGNFQNSLWYMEQKLKFNDQIWVSIQLLAHGRRKRIQEKKPILKSDLKFMKWVRGSTIIHHSSMKWDCMSSLVSQDHVSRCVTWSAWDLRVTALKSNFETVHVPSASDFILENLPL